MDNDKYLLFIDSLSSIQARVLQDMIKDFQRTAWTKGYVARWDGMDYKENPYK